MPLHCFDKKDKPPVTPSDLGLTREEGEITIAKLLDHGYHLPKNNWCQDWIQYMTNNHPVFGICCHHPLHPLSWKLRMLTLVGSILMGLAITCFIYVAFVFSDQDYGKQYVELSTNKTKTGLQADLDDNVSTLNVTNGNIALWTVGAFLHGLYDNMVWALAAGTCCSCKCCEEKCGKKPQDRASRNTEGPSQTRTLIVMLSVIVVVAITFFAVSLQMALTADDETEIVVLSPTNVTSNATAAGSSSGAIVQREQLFRVKTDNAKDYEFIIAYLVELMLNYFGWYPLVGTILFSGILSCGKEPLFGGRIYEMKQDDLEAAERGRRSSNANTKASVPVNNHIPKDSTRSVNTNKSKSTVASKPAAKKSTATPAAKKSTSTPAAKKSTNTPAAKKSTTAAKPTAKKPAASTTKKPAAAPAKKPVTKTSIKTTTKKNPKTGKIQKSTTVSVTKK